MKTNSLVLLRTMYISSSKINVLKNSKDKNKIRSVKTAFAGYFLLSLYLFFSGIFTGFGLTKIGLTENVPSMVAAAISTMALIFTIFKANGYLYSFKEYDMLMSLPFSVKAIVSARFFIMYIDLLPFELLMSFSILLGYIGAVKPSLTTFLIWMGLTFFIPLFPTVVAALLGVIVANVGARVKHKKMIQIILTFLVTIPLFFLGNVLEFVFKSDNSKKMLGQAVSQIDNLSKLFFTNKWFSEAVNKHDIKAVLLLIVVSLIIYIASVNLISINYRKINSLLENAGKKRKNVNVSANYKKKNIINSICFNEFKRITGSTTCAVNIGMGFVLSILVGCVIPFIGIEKLINLMAKGEPFDISPFKLVWPVIVYFFVGMVPSTAPSPSLEGKSSWILQSLPIEKKDIYKGKILFNLYMNLLPGLFAVITGLISLKVTFVECILGLLMIKSMVFFSSIYGLRCGLKHVNYEWDNEIQVVKQSAAVTVYILPNMFATMALVAGYGAFCYYLNANIGALIIIALYTTLAALNYHSINKLT